MHSTCCRNFINIYATSSLPSCFEGKEEVFISLYYQRKTHIFACKRQASKNLMQKTTYNPSYYSNSQHTMGLLIKGTIFTS